MADVDCIRTCGGAAAYITPPVAAVSSPAVASPVVAAPPDYVATAPPDSVATAPPDSVATAPPASVATAVIYAFLVPTISSTFSTFTMSVAKLRNACQTKMADVDLNIQHRQVTSKNHCSKLVRWP